MARTAAPDPSALAGRATLVVVGAVALLAAAYTFVLMAMHVSSLRMNPGTRLRLVLPMEGEGSVALPDGMRHSSASVTGLVDLVAHDVDQTFLSWQTAAWTSRYALAIVVLLSVVYLCWRLGRRRGGLGRGAAWWAGGLGVLVLGVAFFAPWALVHADRLFATAVAVPPQPADVGPDDAWFVLPSWALQDADWWLVLFGALLLLLALLLRRAHRAEVDAEGLV